MSDITTTSATLTLTGHTGNWWLEQTASSAGTCTAGEADFSHAVSGLKIGLQYTYKAYSKATCNSADELGRRTFRTLGPGDGNDAQDFNSLAAAGNRNPYGLWSDGATMWVADYFDGRLYAYQMSDKSRDESMEFRLRGVGNSNPAGIRSDGTTIWVADGIDAKIYAYKMSDKSRDESKEFNTLKAAGNDDPAGIWSNGTTMWVADNSDDMIFAYKMSDKSRDTAKEFTSLSPTDSVDPVGIWSNGVTMWVANWVDGNIYAYKMSDKSRDADKDFTALSAAGNTTTYDIWSDGATMWAADITDDKLYAYYAYPALVPSAVSATSATLTLTGYTGSWWLKKTAPTPAGNCTVGEPDYSHALSNLTAGTTHTYRAYSDSNCTSTNEIAEVTYTRPSS